MRRTSVQDRIRLVGATVYGENWRVRLAEGLGIGRTTLWSVLRGSAKRTAVDVDGKLIALVDREREAAAERGAALTRLRNRLLQLCKVD